MSVKIGPLNQHEYLHPHYGVDNCCLCSAETKIRELEVRLERYRQLFKRINAYRLTHVIENQVDIDPQIVKLIDENFWELV